MESKFTKLEGIKRIISILEGKMQLSHKNKYNITLTPYEIDRLMVIGALFPKEKLKTLTLCLKIVMEISLQRNHWQ